MAWFVYNMKLCVDIGDERERETNSSEVGRVERRGLSLGSFCAGAFRRIRFFTA